MLINYLPLFFMFIQLSIPLNMLYTIIMTSSRDVITRKIKHILKDIKVMMLRGQWVWQLCFTHMENKRKTLENFTYISLSTQLGGFILNVHKQCYIINVILLKRLKSISSSYASICFITPSSAPESMLNYVYSKVI